MNNQKLVLILPKLEATVYEKFQDIIDKFHWVDRKYQYNNFTLLTYFLTKHFAFYESYEFKTIIDEIRFSGAWVYHSQPDESINEI